MTVKQRLIDFLDLKKISKSEFGRAINVSAAYVTSIRKSIDPEKLQSIALKYPDLNLDWLLTGEGQMLKSGRQKVVYKLKNEAEDVGDVVDKYQNQNNDFEVLENGLIRMRTKLVTQKASAGYLTGWGDQEYLNELPTHEVYVREYHKGIYRSFEAVGDSMNDGTENSLPTIKSIPAGSIATGRLISRHLWNSKLHINDFHRYIIVTYEDGIIMKEIIAHNTETGIITCRSLNPNKDLYPDFDLDLQKVMQIFNIVQVTLIDK